MPADIATVNVTLQPPISTANVTIGAPAYASVISIPGVQGTPSLYTSILGTTNEIIITLSGVGNSIATLSTPQAIATTSSPTFAALTITGTASANLFSGSGASLTSIPNAALNNSSVTVTAGTGLSGGGSVVLGSSVTLSNAGVLSLAGTTNQVSVSASTGAITLSLPQSINSGAAPTFAGTNFTSIPNGALTNSSVTVGTTSISLGASSTTLAGLTSVSSTLFTGALTGNATTATTSTNIAGGVAGSIPYQTAAGTTSLLATATGVLVGGSTPSYSTTPTLTGTNFTGIPNGGLTNSSVTVTAGTGMSGGGSVSLGSTITLTNAGVTSLTGTTHQVIASASTGGVTLSLPQSIDTTSAPSFAGVTLTGGLDFYSVTGISAAGTNQGTATVLTADTNVVSTVGSGQGVVLPSGNGREITVINRGANALLVYPPSGAAIDGAAANTATSVPVDGWLTVNCTSSTQYYAIDPVTVGGTGISITQSNNGTITIGNTGVTSIIAGTDTSVSGATGAVTIGDTSTLSSVTGRGATTATAVSITNSTASSSTTTGALIVTGGGGFGGTVYATAFNGPLTGNASTATTATNIAGGAAGSLPYQTGSGATSFIAAGTNTYVLTMVSGAPAWAASSGGGVSSITGTANQIAASASTGAVTLSFPSNIVIPAPASGVPLVINRTGDGDSIVFQRTSVSSMQMGFGDAFLAGQAEIFSVGTVPFGIGTSGSAALHLYADSTLAMTVGAAGNVSIAAPASGVGLTVTGVAGLPAIEAITTGFLYNNSVGVALAMNSSGADFGQIFSSAAQVWALGYGTSATTSGTVALSWSNAGNVTIAAPSSGDALTVNAVSGNYAGVFNAPATGSSTRPLLVQGATSGTSHGIFVQAGLVSTDSVCYMRSASGSQNFFDLYGDGHLTMGGPSGTSIACSAAGNVTVSGTITLSASSCTIGAAVHTYGSTVISDQTGGYAGIQFTGGYGAQGRTLMVSDSAAIQGFYDSNASAWDWYFNAGVLTVGTVPAASINAGTAGISITGNAATVNNNSGRTDATAYPVVWATGADSPLYNCSAVTITSSTGTLSATNVNGTSDIKLKDNISTIKNALDSVSKLRGVNFKWKENGVKSTGLIAQEVAEVIPEVVHSITHESGDEHLSVSYGNLIGLLVEAIKELKAEVDILKGR